MTSMITHPFQHASAGWEQGTRQQKGRQKLLTLEDMVDGRVGVLMGGDVFLEGRWRAVNWNGGKKAASEVK